MLHVVSEASEHTSGLERSTSDVHHSSMLGIQSNASRATLDPNDPGAIKRFGQIGDTLDPTVGVHPVDIAVA